MLLVLGLRVVVGGENGRGVVADADRDFWSFRPVRVVEVPNEDDGWVLEGIDGFVLEGIREAGLEPAAETSRRHWLRRVSFGLTGLPPTSQGPDVREHHPHGYTMWLAGGGVKAGSIYGATDDFGWNATEDRMHLHDFHATLLHLMGIDHERLTYRYSGRDFRLTDVAGEVARGIIG